MKLCHRLRHSRDAFGPSLVVLIVVVVFAGLAASDRALAAGKDVNCGAGSFNTIQAAVDAAPAGSTIQVCDGTYPEQVVIGPGKDNLTIQSQNAAGGDDQGSCHAPTHRGRGNPPGQRCHRGHHQRLHDQRAGGGRSDSACWSTAAAT